MNGASDQAGLHSGGTPAGLSSGTSGIFISFEGIDGAGKSTHIPPLAQLLRAQGRVVVQTREPGGTPLAEQLRALALGESMDPLTEALLMFAARREHLLLVIEPALARGEAVLCDRFTDATFAYQGSGRGFDTNVLGQLERWVQTVPGLPVQQLRQPDLTLWFDLAPEIAAQRLVAARAPDKFESQPVDFFQRVVRGYAGRQAGDPARFIRIEADQPREQVWLEVLAAIGARGWIR